MAKDIIEKVLLDIPHNRVYCRAKEELLSSGKTANSIFIVRSGCVRAWYNAEGKDITMQFFMPGHPVASFDSFINRTPSEYSIQAVMPSEIDVISGEEFCNWALSHPEHYREGINFAINRLAAYQKLFLSRIKDTPQQRYEALLNEQPEIVAQIPQHYIASYLGITSVSLSRIRARVMKSRL